MNSCGCFNLTFCRDCDKFDKPIRQDVIEDSQKFIEEVNQETRTGELLQEENAEGGEDEIGGPDTEDWGELVGLGEGDADVGEEIVGEDEQKSEDDATSAHGLGSCFLPPRIPRDWRLLSPLISSETQLQFRQFSVQ